MPYSKKRADEVLKFIRHLKHVKSPWYGHPFRPARWQQQFLRELYGRTDSNGRRQYRQALLFVPRKSGKTTLASALALYHLFASGEKGGEIYAAAGSRDQASLVFNTARDMVLQNPALRERCRIQDSRKNISHLQTGTFFRALAADANTAYGLNASVVICDELAFWKSRDLYDALVTSTGARSEPLILTTTTAGVDTESVGKEVYSYAKEVAQGTVEDPTFLPWIYEAAAEDAWDEPETWEKANPALGLYRNREELEALCTKAKAVPALESSFRRLYLNQWTSAETVWLPLEKWDQCAQEPAPAALRGRPCYGGLDLSSTTDLSSFTLLFPDDADPPNFDLLSWSWLPEARVVANKDRVPYDSWARQGYLESTPGDVVDYRQIKHRIMELASTYDIKEIGFDRWNSSQLVTELLDAGANMVEVPMTFSGLSAPTKMLEELVLGGRLRHGGNPLLRWAVSGVSVDVDPNSNIKPSKQKSNHRIDPVVAAILALARAQHRVKRSIYEERELLYI